jgi:hypothetical protein
MRLNAAAAYQTPAELSEHDLFGDGSVIWLPTYDHSPGISRSDFASTVAKPS